MGGCAGQNGWVAPQQPYPVAQRTTDNTRERERMVTWTGVVTLLSMCTHKLTVFSLPNPFSCGNENGTILVCDANGNTSVATCPLMAGASPGGDPAAEMDCTKCNRFSQRLRRRT